MVEVGNHGVSQSEVIRWEDELVGPSVELLQHSVGTYRSLCGTHGADAHCTDVVTLFLGLVDGSTGFG